MRFAAFTTVASSAGEATDAEQMIDNLRQQTVLAEELGFEAMWLGEHHFGPYGIGDLPNPILLGADLAARTSRIRIGQMANIAPWWHPIRLAEDLAILDNMTGGRVDVGFGRGIWPYEGPQFHPNADPRKDAENRELFRETVEVVRGIWTNEYFSYRGSNYSFPVEDTVFSHPKYPSNPAWQDGDRVTKLRVTPRPHQKPHPPLWMTVSTDRSVTTAAEMGLKACYWQPPALRIRQRMEIYARARSEREGRPFALGEDQAVMRSTYVASSMEEARRDAEGGHHVRVHLQRPFSRQAGLYQPGRGAGAGREAGLGLPGAAHAAGGFPRQRGGEDPGATGGLQPGLSARRVHPHGHAADQDAEEPGDVRHQGYAAIRRRRLMRGKPRRQSSAVSGSSGAFASRGRRKCPRGRPL